MEANFSRALFGDGRKTGKKHFKVAVAASVDGKCGGAELPFRSNSGPILGQFWANFGPIFGHVVS